MTRRKKLMLNTASALCYQLVSLVCGFVLPKFVIPYFGSDANGLLNSITQFLSVISLCEAGVGAVVQASLYQPLAKRDWPQVSRVMTSSRRFFGKVMKLLAVYVAVLMLAFPLALREKYDYDFGFLASLILILSVSYLAQYYLFVTHKLLLNADQMSFVQLTVHSGTLILNTLATVGLISLGASLHQVKLMSSLVFLLQPLVLKWYVERHYPVNTHMELTEEPIRQKWNGLAQHIASVVLLNTDTVVLTLCSTLKNVSIYSVYHLVAHGCKQVIASCTTGTQAMLGNMYAQQEHQRLNEAFSAYELLVHTLVTALFTLAGILLLPFVRLYTRNFTDANYIAPAFGYLLILAQAVYCVRIPYYSMVHAAGHFRQTQCSAIVEAAVNLGLSVSLVFRFGLVGVAIGTLAAMCYRTGYLAWYLQKQILHRRLGHFLKHLVVDILGSAVMVLATGRFAMAHLDVRSWLWLAVRVSVVGLAVLAGVQWVFYRQEFARTWTLLRGKHRK